LNHLQVDPSAGPHPPALTVEFKQLDFDTKAIAQENPYEHFQAHVKIDSSDQTAYPRDWRPQPTAAIGPTAKMTSGHENLGGVSLSVGTKGGVTGGLTASRKHSRSQETTKNHSRIRAHCDGAFVEWIYDVDDVNERQGGLRLKDERLPFLKYWLESEQTGPLRVRISGYWISSVLPIPKNWATLRKIFERGQAQEVPMLRNFCHSTHIIIPSDLQKTVTSTLHLKACMPCSPAGSADMEREALRVPDFAKREGFKLEGKLELGEWGVPTRKSHR
jgi:hypothetical protein